MHVFLPVCLGPVSWPSELCIFGMWKTFKKMKKSFAHLIRGALYDITNVQKMLTVAVFMFHSKFLWLYSAVLM